MDPPNIDEPSQVWVLIDEEPGKATQRVVRDIDGRWAHRHRQLIQITPGSGSERWCVGDDDIPIAMTGRTVIDQVLVDSEGGHRRTPTLASMSVLAR